MKSLLRFVVGPLMGILVVACSKKDPELTKEQLLTRATGWKYGGSQVYSAGVYQGVGLVARAQCDWDNILKFTINGSYTEEAGPVKCNNIDPDVLHAGSWHFSADKTSLTIGGTTVTSVTVDGSKLTYLENRTINGANVFVTTNWTAQ